jgi:glycogen debranching enzyme
MTNRERAREENKSSLYNKSMDVPETVPFSSESIEERRLLEDLTAVERIYGSTPHYEYILYPEIGMFHSPISEWHRLVASGKGVPVASLNIEDAQEIAERDMALEKYTVPFARDALISEGMLLKDPLEGEDGELKSIVEETLRTLYRWQGTENEPLYGSESPLGTHWWTEEERGKIIHELRFPGDAIANYFTEVRGWGWPYYGAADSTPLTVTTTCDFIEKYTTDILSEEIRVKNTVERKTIGDSLVAAVGWIKNKLEESDVGMVEFKTPNENGAKNQSWRDSWDSYWHEDGIPPNYDKGVVSLAVQGVTHEALVSAARLYDKLSYLDNETLKSMFPNVSDVEDFDHAKFFMEEAQGIWKRADNLKSSVVKNLYIDDGNDNGYFAMGGDYSPEDGGFRPFKVRSSEMGWIIGMFDGANDGVYERTVVRNLFLKMLTMHGIRTVSKDAKNYLPGSYHNGSVWLMENGLIASKLEDRGYTRLPEQLYARNLNISHDTGYCYEFLSGRDTKDPEINHYRIWVEENGMKKDVIQPPQPIQSLTVAAYIRAMKMTVYRMKGLVPERAQDADKRRFEDTILASLPERLRVKPSESVMLSIKEEIGV